MSVSTLSSLGGRSRSSDTMTNKNQSCVLSFTSGSFNDHKQIRTAAAAGQTSMHYFVTTIVHALGPDISGHHRNPFICIIMPVPMTFL